MNREEPSASVPARDKQVERNCCFAMGPNAGVVGAENARINGESMEAIAANLNRTLKSYNAYFKNAHPSELAAIDGWIRMRLRPILRKRKGSQGRGRGRDHQRWHHPCFPELGFFCLKEAREAEIVSLRKEPNH